MEMFKRTTYSNAFRFSYLHSFIFDTITFFYLFLKIVLVIVSGWNLLRWRYVNINCIVFAWPVLLFGISSFWTLSTLCSSKKKAMFQTKRILWVLRREGWKVPKILRPRDRVVLEVRTWTTDPELKIVLSTGSLWECVSPPFLQTREELPVSGMLFSFQNIIRWTEFIN